MFFHRVTETAALRWLWREGGDAELLLSAPPRSWERTVLWLVRADRGELFRVVKLYDHLRALRQVIGICWFAGAEETLDLAELVELRCRNKVLYFGHGLELLRRVRRARVKRSMPIPQSLPPGAGADAFSDSST